MKTPYKPILVVEDMPNVRELLQVTLTFKGYQVVTAIDGEEALQKVIEQRPSLIISDILMPKLDGFAFVQKLRTDLKTYDIPIIFLSATYVTPEDKAFAMSLGAARFIEKPIDTEEFLLTVAELLTQPAPSLPTPLEEHTFYQGYRERLENKLRHKNSQIARTEKILGNLPEQQRPAFQSMLDQSKADRDEIQQELHLVYQMLDELKNKS